MCGYYSLAETDSTISGGHLRMGIDLEPFALQLMLQTVCETSVLKGSATQTDRIQGGPFMQNARNSCQRCNQSVMETLADFSGGCTAKQIFHDGPKKRTGV